MEPLEDLKAKVKNLCNYRERQILKNASADDIARLLEEKRKENLRLGVGTVVSGVFISTLWTLLPLLRSGDRYPDTTLRSVLCGILMVVLLRLLLFVRVR